MSARQPSPSCVYRLPVLAHPAVVRPCPIAAQGTFLAVARTAGMQCVAYVDAWVGGREGMALALGGGG